jgi:hypothetical protein
MGPDDQDHFSCEKIPIIINDDLKNVYCQENIVLLW